MNKRDDHYVFLVIKTKNPERWISVKRDLRRGEELLEFRFSKSSPQIIEEKVDVMDEGDLDLFNEKSLKAKEYI
jgi:hypothetical protein